MPFVWSRICKFKTIEGVGCSEAAIAKRGGGSARKAARAAEITLRLSTSRYGAKPVELICVDKPERLHNALFRSLKKGGVMFPATSTPACWKEGAADMVGETNHFDTDLIESLIGKAP